MRTHVALLRGINVGGRNKVAMADLRAVVSSLGHREVTTYIQSGNALFAAADPSTADDRLAGDLEAALAEQLGVTTPVVVTSRQALRRVFQGNPFADERDPKAVHAVFLRGAPTAEQVAAVAAAVERARAKGSRDEAVVDGMAIYLRTPDGLGRSLLAAELERRPPGARPPAGTARNWATVTALLQLLDG